MKVKLNQQLQNGNGLPFISEGKPPITLKDVIVTSLLEVPVNPSTGRPEKEDDKTTIERYDLFRKIRDKKQDADLDSGEITFIKDRINKSQYTPLVKGEALEMMEGKYKRMTIMDLAERKDEINEAISFLNGLLDKIREDSKM